MASGMGVAPASFAWSACVGLGAEVRKDVIRRALVAPTTAARGPNGFFKSCDSGADEAMLTEIVPPAAVDRTPRPVKLKAKDLRALGASFVKERHKDVLADQPSAHMSPAAALKRVAFHVIKSSALKSGRQKKITNYLGHGVSKNFKESPAKKGVKLGTRLCSDVDMKNKLYSRRLLRHVSPVRRLVNFFELSRGKIVWKKCKRLAGEVSYRTLCRQSRNARLGITKKRNRTDLCDYCRRCDKSASLQIESQLRAAMDSTDKYFPDYWKEFSFPLEEGHKRNESPGYVRAFLNHVIEHKEATP